MIVLVPSHNISYSLFLFGCFKSTCRYQEWGIGIPLEGRIGIPSRGEDWDPIRGEDWDPIGGEDWDPIRGEDWDPIRGEDWDPINIFYFRAAIHAVIWLYCLPLLFIFNFQSISKLKYKFKIWVKNKKPY
jgi:hypothetical protein